MYFLTLGIMLHAAAGDPVDFSGLWRNLVPVIAGNIVGGSVLVALVYSVIYRPRRDSITPGAASTAVPRSTADPAD
jgi:formate/nitrite transporter FocA (FNT family)